MTGQLHGRYVSTAQAAATLGLDVKTVERWCRSGRLRTKPRRNGSGPYRIVRSDVERVQREHEGR